MNWLKKILAQEQDFDVLDYHKKYPRMDREDAETLAALNKIIKEVRAKEKRNDIPEEEWK